MSTISIDTTPEQDGAVKRLAARYNGSSVTGPLTVVQYAAAQMDALLDGWVALINDEG